MIHRKEDGTCTASSNGVWLPGIFEDERTARWAFRFADTDLHVLQVEANKRTKRVVTHADLAALSARKKGDQ